MGRLRMDAPPIVERGATVDPSSYADPLPQARVLTANVFSFATTALLLVVLLASRGQTGHDHVDGEARKKWPTGWNISRARFYCCQPQYRKTPDGREGRIGSQ